MKIKVTADGVRSHVVYEVNECIVPFDVEQSQGHCQSYDWRASEEQKLDKQWCYHLLYH